MDVICISIIDSKQRIFPVELAGNLYLGIGNLPKMYVDFFRADLFRP